MKKRLSLQLVGVDGGDDYVNACVDSSTGEDAQEGGVDRQRMCSGPKCPFCLIPYLNAKLCSANLSF